MTGGSWKGAREDGKEGDGGKCFFLIFLPLLLLSFLTLDLFPQRHRRVDDGTLALLLRGSDAMSIISLLRDQMIMGWLEAGGCGAWAGATSWAAAWVWPVSSFSAPVLSCLIRRPGVARL